ncbi:hypothetical protein DENSPDRAFT_833872 [Dentipellis sp. KUC8613]|nr:hypothetical protein DENSPDRAFT_833872 [Dentipellis sp. KUC8613]
MGQAPSFVPAEAFTPALDTTHTVAVPPDGTPADNVQLLLTANLGSAGALAHYKQQGMQVQAWTDAPVEGSTPGQWAAYTFEAPAAAADADDADRNVDDNGKSSDFSLLGPDEGVEDPKPHVLRLRLPLRPDALGPGQAEVRFMLTYRLVHADGHVHWFGSHGHDVVCVLRKADPWLAVRRGWERAAPAEGDEPGVEVWEHKESSEGDTQFAQIRQTGNWGCWAVGDRSVHYHVAGSEVSDARYLLFIPRVHPTTFALHRPLILYAESGSLHLSSSGMLTCPPSSRIHVFRGRPVDGTRLHDDLDALSLRWLGEQDGFTLIASSEDSLPARIAFIPHLASPCDLLEPRLRTRWDGLEQSVFARPDAYRRYMLFCPASRQMLDYVAGVDYDVALRVGAAGGACVLSPIHALPVPDAADDRDADAAEDVAWEISILSAHAPQQKQPDVGPAAQEPQQEKETEEDETAELDLDLDSARSGIATTATMPPGSEALPAALLQTLVVLVQAAFLRMFFLLTPRFANLSVRPPRSTSATPSRAASDSNDEDRDASYSRDESPGPAADYTDTETLAGTEGPSDAASPRPARVLAFDIYEGPLELVYCRAGAGEGKGAELEMRLDGEPLALSAQAGWTLTVVEGAVRGGRLEAFLTDKREEFEGEGEV